MEVVVSGSPVKPSDEKKREPDKWEINSWVRTLQEAEEIKADPEKMKYVRPQIATQVKAVKNLADLLARRDEVMAAETDDSGDE